LNLEHAEFTEEEGEWLGRHLHTSPSITCVNLRASSLGWPALSSMFKGLVHQSSSSIVTGTNSTVTSLELDENCLGPEGCSELIQPLESKSLTYLSLDGNHLKDAGVETLASLLCDQTTLRSLSLRNNQFQAQGMKSLSTMLHENKALTHLDIDSNRIVESYCHTKWACTAKKISSPGRGREIVVKLGYQHVDGPATQGVAALARALKTNGTLTSLSISGCGISEKAYILLANALQASSSSKLMFLVCDGFSLTPETDSLDCEGVALSAGQVALLAALLKKNETLASLNIARTGVGEAGCKLIGEALHRSAASKVSQLKCDKFSTVGSTALSLESKYLSTADMLLLGAVLARNELLASLTIDGVRLPLKQLMQPGQQSVDKRVPLAGHVIIDFARGIPTSTLAGPAFGAFDDKDEGSVERQCFYERMLTSSGLLFPEIREAWRTIDKDVTIDGDRRISLQGFARGVASNPELAMVATVLTLQRDELSEFLVFRWRGARVPEVVLNAPEYATGKLSIRGVQIGTIGPMSRRAIGDKRKVDRLAERVRFARPRDWLRAVDFMPESVLSVHGKHCPQVEIQCLMGSGEEFSFSVEVSEWSFDLTGARIRLLEGKPAQQCCATLTKHNNADGSASCVIDNSDETRVLELAAPAGELIDCAVWFRSNEALRSRYLTVNIRQRTVDRTSSIIAEFDGPKQVYVTGQRLLLLLDGRVQEATVAVGPGINILRPTRHLLEVTGSSETLRLDLNTYNHCRRRFETAKEFRVARQSLCELLQTQTGAAVAERGGPKQSKGRLRGLESQLRLLANDASEAAVRHWCDVELLLHDAWAGYHAK
jgi:Ran GTPase-activating protein (RanGAP) involved in mRNA processing and transport